MVVISEWVEFLMMCIIALLTFGYLQNWFRAKAYLILNLCFGIIFYFAGFLK